MAQAPRRPSDPVFEEIYIDETSQTGHRFLVIGGIILPKHLSQQFEADIMKARLPQLAVRLNKKMQPSEVGWNSIAKGEYEAYKRVIDAYFSFAKRHLKTTVEGSVQFHCSVVDTRVRGRRYSGGERGQLGFNREIYFHCMSIARRTRNGIFDVYPDERSTNMTMDQMRTILCRGLRREVHWRAKAFRRVQFKKSYDSQAAQISDILIGAVAYRLNGHWTAPGGPDKKALCEYILRKGQFWKFVSKTGVSKKGKPYGAFQVKIRKHKS